MTNAEMSVGIFASLLGGAVLIGVAIVVALGTIPMMIMDALKASEWYARYKELRAAGAIRHPLLILWSLIMLVPTFAFLFGMLICIFLATWDWEETKDTWHRVVW